MLFRSPLFSRGEHVDVLWKQTVQFLFLAYGHDAQSRNALLAKLAAHPTHKTMGQSDVDLNAWLEQSQAFADLHIQSQRTLADEINTLLSAQHIAAGEDYHERVFKKVRYSPEAEKQKSLAAALAWTHKNRLAFDAKEAELMRALTPVFDGDSFLTDILGKLSKN